MFSVPCLLMDRKVSLKNEIDFIHLGFSTPLHNHNPANFSLREIITLMKIKYNLKFTFIFIYLMQVRMNPKWLGKWEEIGFSEVSPPVRDDASDLTVPAFIPLSFPPISASSCLPHQGQIKPSAF